VLISVERYWYQYDSQIPLPNISNDFDSYIDEIIACHWYYKVLDLKYGFLNDIVNNQKHFYNALEHGEYRFWVIQIVPAITNADIIKRAEMPIAVDLFDIDKGIISDIIGFQDSENFFYLDRERIVFTYRDNPWPKIWFPSKSRIYYPGWFVLDTNICALKPIQIKRKWCALAKSNIVPPDMNIYIRQPQVKPKTKGDSKIIKLRSDKNPKISNIFKIFIIFCVVLIIYLYCRVYFKWN
jgi:hypothetical protein